MRTFKELAGQFNLSPTTVNRNYNKAISYHKLRKLKSSTRKSGEKTDQEEGEVETSRSQTPENLSEAGSGEEHSPEKDMDITELEATEPKILLVLKQEPNEQEPFPEGEPQ